MMNAFCKTLLASAIASVSLASAHAAEPLTVYGKLNVTVQSNDEAGADDSETTVQSNASRFGVKGEFDLGNNLAAFYTVEYEVDTGDDAKDNFLARNQFVGLKGNFGAISVGRNDTMLKVSQGKVDQFNDLSGDLKSLFKGENRIEQTVTYLSPSFGGFKVGATYAAEAAKSQDGEDGFSVAAMYGDKDLKKSAVFASIAYDSEVKGYDVLRATVQAKLANFILGGMYQQEEKSVDGDSKNGYLLSAAYKIDAVTLKGQWQDMEDKGDSWSIGADYKLGKPTKLFAFYTNRSMEDMDDDDKYIGVGLEHKF
ncbi:MULTISPECIES: porin [Shewanella]|uniref:Porin n=2 Tax=Unclassified Bacteria TaxID=49928 RepID=A0AAU6VXG3_UNCXX|nr:MULTISPECIES: porin [Shewanella]MBO2587470.1 porin [Shewanella algae]MBO2591765.1 porin [Shewanella algae]MBO2625240.1 porin [Shewanella algae]MCE9776772.1 porin [Shewanella algae]MCE9780864.1 porin [Shewanella algae]